jgi:hypothetical protein
VAELSLLPLPSQTGPRLTAAMSSANIARALFWDSEVPHLERRKESITLKALTLNLAAVLVFDLLTAYR